MQSIEKPGNVPVQKKANGHAMQKQAAPVQDNRPQATLQKKQVAGMNTAPLQKKANNTGLPDQLKNGVEQLSGISMNDVKVHYNSHKPATVQAHAYAQGTDIHVAPGQEKHLPHEAWHVVQQKQGRVKPTKQLKSKVNINDDKGLETEADVMGNKAMTQRFAINDKDDTLQRAYSHMQRPQTGHQHRVALRQGHATGISMQRWEWGDLLDNRPVRSLPGLFVLTEAGLSLAAAGFLFASPNPLLGISPLVVGFAKVARGIKMIYDVWAGGEKVWADRLRMLESIAATVSSTAVVISDPKAAVATLSKILLLVATGVKLLRSLVHWLIEKKGMTKLSIGLQIIETIEGILITAAGVTSLGSDDELTSKLGKLNVATGSSKMTRGLIAGGVAKVRGDRAQVGDQSGGGGNDHVESSSSEEQPVYVQIDNTPTKNEKSPLLDV